MPTNINTQPKGTNHQISSTAKKCVLALTLPIGIAGITSEGKAQNTPSANREQDISELNFRFREPDYDHDSAIKEDQTIISNAIDASSDVNPKDLNGNKQIKSNRDPKLSNEEIKIIGLGLLVIVSTGILLKDLYNYSKKQITAYLAMRSISTLWKDYISSIRINHGDSFIKLKGAPLSGAQLSPTQLTQNPHIFNKVPEKLAASMTFFGIEPSAIVWSGGMTLRPGVGGIRFTDIHSVTPTVLVQDPDKVKMFLSKVNQNLLKANQDFSALVNATINDAELGLVENRWPELNIRDKIKTWRKFADHLSDECKRLDLHEQSEKFRGLSSASRLKGGYFERYLATRANLIGINSFPFNAEQQLNESLEIIQGLINCNQKGEKWRPITVKLLDDYLTAVNKIEHFRKLTKDHNIKASSSPMQSEGGLFDALDIMPDELKSSNFKCDIRNEEFSPLERVRTIALKLMDEIAPKRA